MRKWLTAADIAALEEEMPLDILIPDKSYGEIQIKLHEDGSKEVLVDHDVGSYRCHSQTQLMIASDGSAARSSALDSCQPYGHELLRFHGKLYAFPLASYPGAISAVAFDATASETFNGIREPVCRYTAWAVVTRTVLDCTDEICGTAAGHAERMINDPDSLLEGQRLPERTITKSNTPALDDRLTEFAEAFSIDLDNDGSPEVFLRDRGDYNVLRHQILKKTGDLYTPYRLANWQLIDTLGNDSWPFGLWGNQGLNFLRLRNRTYILTVTYSKAAENLYDLTIFRIEDLSLHRVGVVVAHTNIRVSLTQ